MQNFIKNPISHPEWNPQMGDYYSKNIFEEDKLHERKLLKKKIMIGSLVSIHIIMLAFVFVF